MAAVTLLNKHPVHKLSSKSTSWETSLHQHPLPPPSPGQAFRSWRAALNPGGASSPSHTATTLSSAWLQLLGRCPLGILAGASGPTILGACEWGCFSAQSQGPETFSLTMVAITGQLPAQRDTLLPTSAAANVVRKLTSCISSFAFRVPSVPRGSELVRRLPEARTQ